MDIVLVIGAKNSSNCNRLKETVETMGKPSYLISSPREIKDEWLDGKENIGLTAGASAPEILVEEVIKKLKIVGASIVKESPGIKESVVFSLPKELIKKAKEIE